MNCTFIRYNPDSFKLANKTRIVRTNNRLNILKCQIDKEITKIRDSVVSIIKLFYDNDEDIYICEENLSVNEIIENSK